MLELREFSEEERDAVVSLWERVFPEDPARNEPTAVIERKLTTQRELFLVALLGGRLVGTALGGYDGVRGWVYHLAVDPDHRRTGLGRALMEAMEQRLRSLGCPKLNLQVRAENAEVVRFYEALGYSVEPRVSMGKPIG